MAGPRADPAYTGCERKALCALTRWLSLVLFSFLIIVSLELRGLEPERILRVYHLNYCMENDGNKDINTKRFLPRVGFSPWPGLQTSHVMSTL